jgi:hypothetical protein
VNVSSVELSAVTPDNVTEPPIRKAYKREKAMLVNKKDEKGIKKIGLLSCEARNFRNPFHKRCLKMPRYTSWSRVQDRTARRRLERVDDQLERLRDISLLREP